MNYRYTPKSLKVFLQSFILALCFCSISKAQTLSNKIQKSNHSDPNVIATAGGFAKFNSIELEWTLGESFIGEAIAQTHLYTIGFHQPTLKIKPEFQLDEAFQNEIDLFPNPMNNSLNVKFKLNNAENTGKFNFVMTDLSGKIIIEKEIESTSQNQLIDIPNLPSAMYQVKISTNTGKLSRTFKIVKTN